LNSLAAQIAVIDHDGTITHVNDAWRRFSTQNGGSPHTDDVGTNYLAVCQLATGLNTEGASESYAGLRALLDGEIDEFTMEYPCHAPHEQRWFSLRAVPLKGDRRRAVVSHINITQNKQIENALRRGEKRLKLALAQRPITIFEHDLTFRYTWLQIAGDDYPGPDSQGCTDADLLPEADAAHLTHLKQECLRRREPTHHIVTLDWGGAPTAYDMTLEPLLDTQGRVVGLTGTYTRHEKP
ncbi:MAG: PAS domain-containing protein, partial [Anaerolineales bacterium]